MKQTTGRQRLPGGVPTPGPAEFKLPQPQTGLGRDATFCQARRPGPGNSTAAGQPGRTATSVQTSATGFVSDRSQGLPSGGSPPGHESTARLTQVLVRPAQGHGSGFQVTPGGTNKGGPHGNISSDQRHGVHVRLQSGTAVGREPAGPRVNCQTNSSLVRPAQRHGSGFQVTPGGTNKGGPHGNIGSGQHHGVHVRLQSGAAIGQEHAGPRVPA